MHLRDEKVDIAVGGQHVAGTLLVPQDRHANALGVLFIHGWGGSQEQYLERARMVAGLGCACLTFDLRGHEGMQAQHETVTREDNLHDVMAAYKVISRYPGVDPSRIAVAGSSYGAYLGAILTALVPVRWLSLRAPALYKDAGWDLPKRKLHQDPDFAAFRTRTHRPVDNRALDACARFRGDALVVESQDDSIVPHAVVGSYVAALANVRSLTVHVIQGADHGLSRPAWRQAYTDLLVTWIEAKTCEAVSGAEAARRPAQAVRPGG